MLCNGEEGICDCVLWLTLMSSCDSSHSALPVSTYVLIATHTSYWQQLNEGTKDATSRPNPKVGSWSTSWQRSTRPGQRLSIRWTVTVNIAVKCRSLSAAKRTIVSSLLSIALSWWRWYRMVEDIQLVNTLDNNSNIHHRTFVGMESEKRMRPDQFWVSCQCFDAADLLTGRLSCL